MFSFQRTLRLKCLMPSYVLLRIRISTASTRRARKARSRGAFVSSLSAECSPLTCRQNISSGKAFTWENLNYHVPVAGGQKRLLHDVFGYVKPGSLTALMGASGAGG